MNATAALLLTVLFVADDPSVPSIVIDLQEDAKSRACSVFIVSSPGSSVTLRDGPVEGSTRLRTWPTAPRGASLVAAADGFVFSVDDAGDWQGPKNADGQTPSGSKDTPDLPVASDRGLRLFLPSVVEGSAGPASLHGTRTRMSGTAYVVNRASKTLALSVVKAGNTTEIDAGPALVAKEEAKEEARACAPTPAVTMQAVTKLTSTTTICAGNLAVSPATGKRFGDVPAKDKDARGLVVMRR